MIRILECRAFEGGKVYVNGACLSGEEKPVGNYVTGSRMIEADTGDVYMFAEGDSPAWTLISTGAGHPADTDD